MKLDSENLLNLKLIDEIIKEPMGGAHRDPDLAASSLKRTILKNLDELSNFSIDELIDRRYQRLMTYGK